MVTVTHESNRIDPTQVIGWGVDADAANDPTAPMKQRTNGEHAGYSWERPTLQEVDLELLQSNERPNVSAVFGESTPPSGLSGMIRRFAFRYSESSYGHWLPLILADRVNEVEGVLQDLTHGHVPNILAERGLGAEWKHNRAGLLGQVFVGAVVVSAVAGLIASRRTLPRTWRTTRPLASRLRFRR